MNTDEAYDTLAKAYGIPKDALVTQVCKIKGDDNGSSASNLALAAWLREQSQKTERGMGAYGQRVHPSTLSECALLRLAAQRLEECNRDSNMLEYLLYHFSRYATKEGDNWTLPLKGSADLSSFKEAIEAEFNKPVALA